MVKVKKCLPYTSKVVGRTLLKVDETKAAFKVYFVDIVGRAERQRYEWALCGATQEDFLARLKARRPEGVGFVTAFPHITKIFQFGPSPETNLYTRSFDTKTFEEKRLDYAEGATEVACAAEALILAQEFRFWLDAESVEAYLAKLADAGDASFRNCAKLAAYYGQG
ncbi:MAG: hypothetical protein FJ272_13415 [Planctomycetes bacterium]|nr:hypothetical protein [Planctomycetota bacterium]